jgi:hypothetical protein
LGFDLRESKDAIRHICRLLEVVEQVRLMMEGLVEDAYTLGMNGVYPVHAEGKAIFPLIFFEEFWGIG